MVIFKKLGWKHWRLISAVLTYFASCDKRYANRKKLLELEDSVLKEGEKFMKTDLFDFTTIPWDEESKEEIRQELLQKGRQEGHEDVAIRMLREGTDHQKIQELTQLSMERIKQLTKAKER